MALRPGKRVGLLLTSALLAGISTLPLLAQSETATPPVDTPVAPEASPAAPAVADPVAPVAQPVENAPDQPATPAATPAAVPADPVAAQTDLETVESSITLSQTRIDELKAEIAAMEGDRTKQNAALIAAAQRVKLAEIEVADVEERLSTLIVDELQVRGRLDGSNAEIANVLAALERISLNPPPALIVDPADALGSARSAILISAIVPQLRAKADSVTADLKALTDIKIAALAEEATLKANYSVLEEEQLRIATLIAARKQGIGVRTAQLEAEEAEAVALAARATTLKDLIDSLSAQVTSVSTAVAASNAAVDPDAPVMTAEAIQVALANSARTEPAVPFGAAKGYLTMPANGVNVVDFGAGDGFGGISQGISVVTRAEAQVVAPADGWVLYKGPYLNYGQIIILNTGQNYTALLAGLETITVDIGQFVQMGMPLGTMGSRTIGRTVTTNAGADQPTLYIELRQNNEPVDPTGWWATPTQSG
ncbi:murein hydrolase activator EnvC family protein [Devosia sp. SL43]|uniref:murein hydrolase activator EnvC family protein n=1 Tax=Devosia sp. SL43 TaxID=2806348 RepID=UPI001F2CFE5C|nr:peptidoglycan DD-metalloendopeptidase family protein [Devosia sp. SL43]UJW84154.1 peptidoglycan DD-metalloendopeptidase family protein [Devosia sp. SL43]